MKIIDNIIKIWRLFWTGLWSILPSPLKKGFKLIDGIRRKIWGVVPYPLKIVMSTVGFTLTTIAFVFGLFFFFPDLAEPITDKKGKNYNYASHQPDIIHLDQGWNEAYRHKFYFTPQGSQILPLDMALALEEKGTTEKFFGTNGLAVRKYGYVPYPKSEAGKKGHSLNPDGLPLGFTVDGFIEPKFQGTHKITTPMLGMNCAACHTSNMHVNGKTIRIDGNQSFGDFMGLLTAIDMALAETVTDDSKFERFTKAMNVTENKKKIALRQKVKSVLRNRQAWQRRNAPHINPGHGRVDAFGVIFNQVAARDLHLDSRESYGNVHSPDAPVSYPVLWDTPHMARVQWNGSANNKKAGGVLGRNFGQVLGVFGSTEVTKENATFGHCSTVKRHNLNKMDYWIRSLNSPKWSDPALKGILPDLDSQLMTQGSEIYQTKCASCHAVVPDSFRDIDPHDKKTCDLPITVVDVDIVGTDPSTAQTGIRPNAKTGTLEGLDSLSRRGEKMAPEEPYANVLREVVTRSIVGSFRPLTCDNSITIKRPIKSIGYFIDMAAGLGKISKSRKGKAAEIGGGFDLNPSMESLYKNSENKSAIGRDPTSECDAESTKYIYLKNKERQGDNYHPYGYRARPLNGIWASAPYLHNGSVPSLADMLNKVADPISGCPDSKTCRPDLFYVGNTEYDPVKAGYVYDVSEGFTEFNTQEKGNFNTGHNWGTDLDPDSKAALLEYLKSL